MSTKRSVAKSRRRRTSRSFDSAQRSRLNSPCGRSATWVNWSTSMPRRPVISAVTSVAPVATGFASPSLHRLAPAASVVVPSPRFLGRSHSGVRSTRQVTSPIRKRRTTRV